MELWLGWRGVCSMLLLTHLVKLTHGIGVSEPKRMLHVRCRVEEQVHFVGEVGERMEMCCVVMWCSLRWRRCLGRNELWIWLWVMRAIKTEDGYVALHSRLVLRISCEHWVVGQIHRLSCSRTRCNCRLPVRPPGPSSTYRLSSTRWHARSAIYLTSVRIVIVVVFRIRA